MKKTKTDLITGFLGAGKTTFIIKYREFCQAKGEKVTVIENEFCGYDVDSQILTENGGRPISLAGECMCCTGKEHFKELLIKCAEEGFDRVIVEPSGIYEVSEFFSVLESENVGKCCEIGSILTIFDPAFANNLTPESEELMVSQVLASGKILLSKTALHTEEEVNSAHAALEQLLSDYGAHASVFTKDWETLTDEDFKTLSECGYHRIAHAGAPSQHSQIFNTIMMKSDFPDTETFRKKLDLLFNSTECGTIMRVKGYMKDTDKNVWLVNCTPGLYDIKKSTKKRGILVLIGSHLNETAVKAYISGANGDGSL